jgi:hypothetical protein
LTFIASVQQEDAKKLVLVSVMGFALSTPIRKPQVGMQDGGRACTDGVLLELGMRLLPRVDALLFLAGVLNVQSIRTLSFSVNFLSLFPEVLLCSRTMRSFGHSTCMLP